MPRNPPHLRIHRQSGRAIVTISDAKSKARRDVLLGDYGSAEAAERYHLLIAWWEKHGRRLAPAVELARDLGLLNTATISPTVAVNSPTVRVLILRYLRYAEDELYRKPDGSPSTTIYSVRMAMRVLRSLYDEKPAAAFGPKALKQVRAAMIARGWARDTIASRLGYIRAMFRWAASEEMIPESVPAALATVAGLRKGQQGVRSGKKVKPAPQEQIDAVLAIAPEVVRRMIRVQLATGMRPGELVIMRGRDIEMGSDDGVWTYRPQFHKLEHHDIERVIMLGPEAQAELAPLMPPARALDAYLFRPTDAGDKAAVKALRDRYTGDTYRRRIERLCDQAYSPPAELQRRRLQAGGRKKTRLETHAEWRTRLGEEGLAALVAWQKAHRWRPNQLRHNAATRLRKLYGLEAAKLILGHTQIGTTEIYAERDLEKARQIAKEAG